MARFVLLGRLEELAGAPEIVVELAAPTPLSAAIEHLPAALRAALAGPKVRVAVRGEVIGGDWRAHCIEDGDEVALLPPVSGG